MNEKKMKLIESGVKLFAQKGYHSTSIQEIATEAGISKGAFYIYFQSKEDFIATAYHHFHTQINERLEKVKQESAPPKQSLANQIKVLIDYIYKYKDFIIIHLRENISIGKNTDKLIHQMKIENFHWLRENIQAIYGNAINSLLIDTVIQLEGLINGYCKWIVIDDIHIEKEKAGNFIVRRLDDIVNGMLEQSEEPLITINHIPEEYEKMMEEHNDTQLLSETLLVVSQKINQLNIEKKKMKQLEEVIRMLKREIRKKERQPVVIQGLLAHFGNIPSLQQECGQLANLLDVELLN